MRREGVFVDLLLLLPTYAKEISKEGMRRKGVFVDLLLLSLTYVKDISVAQKEGSIWIAGMLQHHVAQKQGKYGWKESSVAL